MMDNVLEVQLRILMWMVISSNWNKTSNLGQTVYNHPDRVITLDRSWEFNMKSMLTSSHFHPGIDKG